MNRNLMNHSLMNHSLMNRNLVNRNFVLSIFLSFALFGLGCSEGIPGGIPIPVESDSTDRSGSYQEDRPFAEVFASVREYYRENHPAIDASLRPGASEEDILALESALGLEFPEELKELYRLADGQGDGEHPFLADGYELMPIETVLETWQMLNEIEEGDGFQTIGSGGPVRADWWRREWIPFAYMITGDHLCVDLAPGTDGVSGQVIEFIHDDTARDRLARNLTDFFGKLDDGLRQRTYFMDPEIEIIVSE